MPSSCRTAACAARHDQVVERVLVFAQSMILEILPERFFGKARGIRFGGGDDQSVDIAAVDISDIGVITLVDIKLIIKIK